MTDLIPPIIQKGGDGRRRAAGGTRFTRRRTDASLLGVARNAGQAVDV
jgi:hypothetical protein